MDSFIVTIILGILCLVMGTFNMKGNISSLHSYHRKRVREEDKIPFGKKVGLGTIIIGIGMIIFGILSYISEMFTNNFLMIIGSSVMIICLVIGISISFYAMFKYNKGIF